MENKMKWPLLAVFALLMARGECANTWYVDCTNGMETADGKTAQTAVRLIQTAVDKAAAGDTVLVAPGVYDEGNTESSRVFIEKGLTLKSTHGRDATHIVGRRDPDSKVNGLGANAIRCVGVKKGLKSAVRIEGFTLREGASKYTLDDAGNTQNIAENWGGGVYGSDEKYTLIVDCTIENCAATRGGAAGYVTAVRTLFRNNLAVNVGAGLRTARAYNCVFVGQRGACLGGFTHMVNCTFVGNENVAFNSESFGENTLVNCVSVGNAKTEDEIGANCKYLGATNSVLMISDATVAKLKGSAGIVSCQDDPYVLFSPLTDDYRPVRGSSLDGTGSVDGLALIPAEFRGTDFLGNPRTTDGKVCVGAVEVTAPVPATQPFHFIPNMSVVSNLHANGRQRCLRGWVNAETWPAQVSLRIETIPGTFLFNVKTAMSTVYRYPKEDGSICYTLPRAGTEPDVLGVTNTFVMATAALWADPHADASVADGTEARPYRTLQAAVDAAGSGTSKYTLIRCRPGDYAEGGKAETTTAADTYTFLGSATITNRVLVSGKNVFFRSTDGAATTFITGHRDTASGIDGLGTGPAAVRCVHAASSNYQFGMMGFTIRDSATARLATNTQAVDGKNDYGDVASNGGAIFMNAGANQKPVTSRNFVHTLMDCVVTNASGSRGAAIYGGCSRRCRIYDCQTTKGGGGWIRGAQLVSCLVSGSDDSSYEILAGSGSHAWQTTTWSSSTKMSPNSNSADYYGCLFDGKAQRTYDPADENYELIGCFNGTSYTKDVTAMPNVALNLANAPCGDVRPCADSPDLYFDPATVTNFCYFVADDIDGRPLVIRDGKVMAGACQDVVSVLKLGVGVTANGDRTGRLPLVDASVTLTTGDDPEGKRNFLGYRIAGEVVPPTSGRTLVWTPQDADEPKLMDVSAAFSPDWYVNAGSGDDGADGWTPETAKRTLVGAMANVVSGDVVHASAGVYREGTQVAPEKNFGSEAPGLANRVVVPSYVTLEGAGADLTFIEGETDPASSAVYGLGANAVRGVHLGFCSVLRKVTVRGGRTRNNKMDAEDDCAGGVMGRTSSDYNRNSLVEDCVISDCASGRGGGARWGIFNRVRFLSNKSTVNGSASREGYYFNCFFDDNIGSQVLLAYSRIENCTLTDRNRIAVSATADVAIVAAPGSSTAGNLVCNSVFQGVGSYPFHYVSNCVFATGSTYTNRLTNGAVVAPEGSNLMMDVADMKLDGDGRPSKDSPVVDAGDGTMSHRGLGTLDLYGTPRVMNADALDIGACEYDWRPDYARALGSGIAVTRADPSVALVDGRVCVPDGAALDLEWSYLRQNGKKTFAAEVGPGGACRMSQNGGEAVSVEGKTTVAAQSPRDAFSFLSSGGSTFLSDFNEACGMFLFLR